jgi:uncharacterized protein
VVCPGLVADEVSPADAVYAGGSGILKRVGSSDMTAATEAVRASYEAFARGDLDGVLVLLHEEVEWHQAQGLPHGGVYRGSEAVRENVFEPLDAEWWAEFEALPNELIDGGDEVVVLGRYVGTAKDTGKRLDVPFVHVWSLRGGRAWRFRQFLDTRGWVEALA